MWRSGCMFGQISAFVHLSVAKRSEYFAVKAKDDRRLISCRSGGLGCWLAQTSPSVNEDLSVKFGLYSWSAPTFQPSVPVHIHTFASTCISVFTSADFITRLQMCTHFNPEYVFAVVCTPLQMSCICRWCHTFTHSFVATVVPQIMYFSFWYLSLFSFSHKLSFFFYITHELSCLLYLHKWHPTYPEFKFLLEHRSN